MADVLLFDLGGVLVENTMFQELAALSPLGLDHGALRSRMLSSEAARAFERGETTPRDFATGFMADLEIDLPTEDFIERFTGWPKGLYPGAKAMLEELKRRHRVCCLSNSNALHWHGPLIETFDAAFSSHEIGHVKPDREAFDHVVEALDVAPCRILFFDDAPVNVEAARACGLQAFHTDGFEALRQTLNDLGLWTAME